MYVSMRSGSVIEARIPDHCGLLRSPLRRLHSLWVTRLLLLFGHAPRGPSLFHPRSVPCLWLGTAWMPIRPCRTLIRGRVRGRKALGVVIASSPLGRMLRWAVATDVRSSGHLLRFSMFQPCSVDSVGLGPEPNPIVFECI